MVLTRVHLPSNTRLPSAQAYDGAAATAGEGGAASVQQQQAVLRRCLARAHELRLPELAALASLARHILHLLC